MEFIEKLVEAEDSIRMKDYQSPFGDSEERTLRLFNRVTLKDGVHLSIQCSYAHYCSPRKTVDVLNYTTMELAIFKDEQFTNVNAITNNKELANELNEYYEGTVYGYVPVELIEKLYQELSK